MFNNNKNNKAFGGTLRSERRTISEQTIANHVLQMLIRENQWDSQSSGMIEVINNEQPESLGNLNYLDFEMLNELSARITTNIKIQVDVSGVSEYINDIVLEMHKREVVENLILSQAPQPLMQSLFQIRGSAFIQMRKSLNVESKGGRPKALTSDETTAVEASWNHYIKRLMNEGKYQVGDEAYLIAETMYSIYQETKIPILHFYPLLDNRCSHIIEFVDFEKLTFPALKQTMDYAKHTNSMVLAPFKQYL